MSQRDDNKRCLIRALSDEGSLRRGVRQRSSNLRLVYRLSVVTSLPLLTPQQVDRSLDLLAWEQMPGPTLCGQGQVDKRVIPDAMRQ